MWMIRVVLRLLILGLVACHGIAAELEVDKSVSKVFAEVKASPPHSFEVVVTDFESVLSIDDSGAMTAARFTFDFADLDSDSNKRDSKMRSWMNVELNPVVEFVLEKTETREEGLVAIGELVMHGVSRQIEIPYSSRENQGKWILEGDVVLDHQEWGLEIVKLLFFRVKPKLGIRIHIEGVTHSE